MFFQPCSNTHFSIDIYMVDVCRKTISFPLCVRQVVAETFGAGGLWVAMRSRSMWCGFWFISICREQRWMAVTGIVVKLYSWETSQSLLGVAGKSMIKPPPWAALCVRFTKVSKFNLEKGCSHHLNTDHNVLGYNIYIYYAQYTFQVVASFGNASKDYTKTIPR